MKSRTTTAIALAYAGLWYFVVVRLVQHRSIFGTFFPITPNGAVLNSMAGHLLAGQFDVDTDAAGAEAYEVDGKTVSYFGIFCALFRIPLFLRAELIYLDLTEVSCIAATVLGAWFQLAAIAAIRPRVSAVRGGDTILGCLVVCVLLGGQQIQFLRPTVYQETIDWAHAFAMGFVWLAVRDVAAHERIRTATLLPMAIFAGLALLTRVTFGIGMYAALAGLFLTRIRRPGTIAVPVALLLGFAIVFRAINTARWGAPWIVVDTTKYTLSQEVYPERLGHLAAYGNFNLSRIWLGLSYYFAPIWSIVRSDGDLLFAETMRASVDSMELPIGSFFLSDPLLLALSVIGAGALLRHWRIADNLAIVLGLAVPAGMMLCAISMSYRYRMEFYPAMVAAATIGLVLEPKRLTAIPRSAAIGATAVSVLVSHAMLAIYTVSPFGSAELVLPKYGWLGTYIPRLLAGHD